MPEKTPVNSGPDARNRRPRIAILLAGVLTLSACGGGGSSDDSEDPATTPAVSTPTGSVKVPPGTDLTAPGTQLKFGDTATVAYELKVKRTGNGKGGNGKGGSGTGKANKPRKKTIGTVLDLTVDSAVQGALSDFAGFNLTDAYQRRANYYYVQVAVKNAGKKTLGGVDVPLWGISGRNTLLPPVRFTSTFDKCPSEQLPAKFRPGDRFKTCLVFLSPNKGSLEGVSYRPRETDVPVEWHGHVKLQPKKKAPGTPSKGKKGSKGSQGSKDSGKG